VPVYAEWPNGSGSMGLREIAPAHCPNGHMAPQRPGWTGANQHGHRVYACSVCNAATPDPACKFCGRVRLSLVR